MHTLSPVTDKINVVESAEGEMKVSVRIGYQIRDLWLLSQTLILVICAKFQYLLNVLFCEPSEIHEYKQNFTVFPEFRTMLIFTNGNLKRSLLRPGPEVIKLFSCSTQLSMKFFLLINVKMPTIVGILTFMSRKNSLLL